MFDENFLMSVATIGAFCVGDFAEAVGVMLFFQIGELFEHIAVEKSRSQIMDAVDMRPETVQWEHDGKVETIPAEEAEVEDILVVRPGDRIPLDGVVVEGESFWIRPLSRASRFRFAYKRAMSWSAAVSIRPVCCGCR